MKLALLRFNIFGEFEAPRSSSTIGESVFDDRIRRIEEDSGDLGSHGVPLRVLRTILL